MPADCAQTVGVVVWKSEFEIIRVVSQPRVSTATTGGDESPGIVNIGNVPRLQLGEGRVRELENSTRRRWVRARARKRNAMVGRSLVAFSITKVSQTPHARLRLQNHLSRISTFQLVR